MIVWIKMLWVSGLYSGSRISILEQVEYTNIVGSEYEDLHYVTCWLCMLFFFFSGSETENPICMLIA